MSDLMNESPSQLWTLLKVAKRKSEKIQAKSMTHAIVVQCALPTRQTNWELVVILPVKEKVTKDKYIIDDNSWSLNFCEALSYNALQSNELSALRNTFYQEYKCLYEILHM